jgi:hypothetical protein
MDSRCARGGGKSGIHPTLIFGRKKSKLKNKENVININNTN